MKSEEIRALFEQFESISAEVEGVECWSARELQKLLGYAQWRNFENIINKAKDACINAGENVAYHFADVSKVIEAGKGAQHEIDEILLTRYACYLIVQNGDSRKEQIAFAQNYFAAEPRIIREKDANTSVFEQIRRIDEHGEEFWSARELWKILEYTEYRHFLPVIEKAKIACKNSGQPVENHFEDVLEMVSIGSETERALGSVKLSRYACYLVVQNADPSKEVVANGQTYFAVQTRIAEIRQMDEYARLNTENEKRLFLRNELTRHNIQLADAAKDAGVIEPRDYAIFQNYGYQGLYGGLGAQDIHKLRD